MNKFLGLSIMTLAFISCNSSGDTQRQQTVTTQQPAPALVTPTTVSNLAPVEKTDSVPPATTQKISATKAATTALNPAHGAPGHRCDISVGAPLSTPIQTVPGAATPATPPQVTVQQQPVTQPAPQPAAGKGVKLNPAHGAPGHDCNIAVGQPLKS